MARFTCPRCAARVTVSGPFLEGMRVRCHDCGVSFAPRAADPDHTGGREPQPRPPRTGKKRASRSGAWLAVLLIGGGFAALMTVGLIVLGVVLLLSGVGGLPNLSPGGLFGLSRVTEENFHKLARGMSMSEVEDILGPGTECTINDFFQAANDTTNKMPPELQARPDVQRIPPTWRRWKNGGLDIFVNFRKGKSGVERVCGLCFINRLPGGAIMSGTQGDNPLEDLDATAAARAKNVQLVNDPKWKKGPAIRAALVGKWPLLGLPGNDRIGWDFNADGTCVHYGTFGGGGRPRDLPFHRRRAYRHVDVGAGLLPGKAAEADERGIQGAGGQQGADSGVRSPQRAEPDGDADAAAVSLASGDEGIDRCEMRDRRMPASCLRECVARPCCQGRPYPRRKAISLVFSLTSG
jgi:hypothetical protein